MIDLHIAIGTITKIAKSAAPFSIRQAQRHEIVVRILTELKLDPVQPPKDFDGVYIYALVEYCVGKPEPILNVFREKEIKKAFWNAYINNCPLGFLKQTKHFLFSQETEYRRNCQSGSTFS